MAQQAILAANKRRRFDRQATSFLSGSLRRNKVRKSDTLLTAFALQETRVNEFFTFLDENGDALVMCSVHWLRDLFRALAS